MLPSMPTLQRYSILSYCLLTARATEKVCFGSLLIRNICGPEVKSSLGNLLSNLNYNLMLACLRKLCVCYSVIHLYIFMFLSKHGFSITYICTGQSMQNHFEHERKQFLSLSQRNQMLKQNLDPNCSFISFNPLMNTLWEEGGAHFLSYYT